MTAALKISQTSWETENIEIIKEIGRGNTSTIYSARHDSKIYALKVLQDREGKYSLERKQAFFREASIVARAANQNLVQIYKVSQPDQEPPFMVMELIEGQSLGELIKRGPLDEMHALSLISQIASGLESVHRYGLVHRDLKPENIMITPEGLPKIIDLGLAVNGTAEDRKGEAVGSFLYSPPEQTGLLDRHVDSRSDLYSVGIIFYECLTGEVPFLSQDIAELLQKHLVEKASNVREIRPEVSVATSLIIEKLLEKDPDDRYSSTHSLLADLKKLNDLNLEVEKTGKASLGLSNQEIRSEFDLPLAGRKNEETQLEAVLSKVLKNIGQIVVISGDPGSGKSRLARELLYKAHDSSNPHLLVSKASMSGGVPFGPIREAIETYLSSILRLPDANRIKIESRLIESMGNAASLLKSFSKGLGALFKNAKDPVEISSQEKFVATLSEFLSCIAVDGEPLIFMLDDIQWLDDSSAKVIKHFSSKIQRSPVLFLASMRQSLSQPIDVYSLFDGSVQKNLSVLNLKPLDLTGTENMISDYLGKAQIDKAAIHHIHSRSHGNPFAVQQFLIAILDAGGILIDWGTWKFSENALTNLNISSDVTQLLLDRTKSLSNKTKFILEHAAIVADEFTVNVLVYISGFSIDEVRRGISEALSCYLIEAGKGDTFRFLHDRIREAFLSVWSKEQLPEIHQKIAEYLEDHFKNDESVVFELARHYGLGRVDLHPKKMFDINFKAAQSARKNYALREAISYFEKSGEALIYDSKLADADYFEQFADCCFRIGRLEDSFQNLQAAQLLSKTPLQTARILGMLSYLLMNRGEKQQSWQALNTAFAELGARPLELKLALKLQALFYWIAAVFIDKVIGILPTPKDPKKIHRLQTLVEISSRATFMAYYDFQSNLAILSTFRAALWARQLGISKELILSYCNLGMIASTFHLSTTAERYYQKAILLSQNLADPSILAYAHVCRAIGFKFNGFDVQAETTYREVLAFAPRWCDPARANSCISGFCQNLIRKGFFKEALTWVEKGQEISDAPETTIELESYRTAIYSALGRFKEAEESAVKVETYLDRLNSRALRALHACNKGIYFLEKDELSSEVDSFVDQYEASKLYTGFAPAYARATLLPCLAIRYRQWLKASPEEKQNRRKKLVHAIFLFGKYAASGSLRLKIEPIIQAHLSAVKGAFAAEEGRFDEAMLHLDLAETLSIRTDCQWSLFEVFKTRASIFYKQGHDSVAEYSHRAAFNIATQQGWTQRLADLKRDFKILPQLTDRTKSTGQVTATATVSDSPPGDSVQQMRLQKQLNALLELGAATSKVFGLEAHCQLVMKQMIKLLNPERVFLFLFDKSAEKIIMQLGSDAEGNSLQGDEIAKYSRTVVEKVRVSRMHLVLTSSDSGETVNSESVVAYNLRSIMAVPLLLQGELIGVIYMDSRVAKGIFNETDVQLLMTFGGHIAVALETAKSAQLEIEKATLEKDIEVVGAVQSLLLPKFNKIETQFFEACAFFKPASQAGGDWWWMTKMVDDKLRIVVADVTGHGAGSAMVTALVAGSYQTTQRLLGGDSVGDMLENLNEIMLASCGQDYWMTFTVVEFDPHKKELQTWFMGSPEIYVAHKTETKLMAARAASGPLGSGSLQFSSVSQAFAPGDQLIVFTDGIYEFQTAEGTDFDIRHLKRLFDKTRKIEQIESQVAEIAKLREEKSGTSKLEDDITFVIVKFRS